MAIAVASSTKTYGISPPLTCTKPSGVASGDLLIIIAFGKWNNTFNASCTGFTQIATSNNGGEGLTVLKRVADGSEGASFSVTNGQTEIMIVYILRVTGWSDSWSSFTTEQNNSNGVFSTLDITPPAANSLIIFAQWNTQYTGSNISGWAIATSNPTWSAVDTDVGNNGNAFGQSAVAAAVRPEATLTGDFSITDSGNAFMAVAFAIAPQSGLANVKTSQGVAKANVKTLQGVAFASVKSLQGVV